MSGESAGRGILFVLSAPSGAGKSTLARRLLTRVSDLVFSVSYTTRSQREGEENGHDYHFVDDASFERMVVEGAFLEWARVHGCNYGTAREATERALGGGRDLVLDVDVQGGRQIRESGVEAVLVFILPPDFATLERRLRARSSEGDAEVRRRLSIAAREAEEFSNYDYLIVNDELDRATDDLVAIVRAERRRVSRRRHEAERILTTIPRP